MTPGEIDEAFAGLGRDRLAAIALEGPPPVFATISGAHLYGFASRDSDVDLRGAFLLPLRQVLGLATPRETITLARVVDGVELDWVAHDLRKLARMLVQHNGYVLEQVFSPLVVLSTPAHAELVEIARGCVTRPLLRHYLGFAAGRRKRLREPDPTVKHLLYAYRVYLTGIHAMRTGEIDAHLPRLDAVYRVPEVKELVERKREGGERLAVSPAEAGRHETTLDALERRLVDEHAHSRLPEEATTRRELEDLVIRLRLSA